MLLVVRDDEVEHRDVNHKLADKLANERTLLTQLELESTDSANNKESKSL